MKNRVKSVFFEVINSNVFNNIKITLHYSVYMRTLDEKVRISDEANVLNRFHIPTRSLSELHTVVCLRQWFLTFSSSCPPKVILPWLTPPLL